MTLARSGPGRRGGQSHFRFPTLLRWISRMVETRMGMNAEIQLPAASPLYF